MAHRPDPLCQLTGPGLLEAPANWLGWSVVQAAPRSARPHAECCGGSHRPHSLCKVCCMCSPARYFLPSPPASSQYLVPRHPHWHNHMHVPPHTPPLILYPPPQSRGTLQPHLPILLLMTALHASRTIVHMEIFGELLLQEGAGGAWERGIDLTCDNSSKCSVSPGPNNCPPVY